MGSAAAILSLFACVQVDADASLVPSGLLPQPSPLMTHRPGQWLLLQDVGVTCWEGAHARYVSAIGVPGLSLIGLFPLAIFRFVKGVDLESAPPSILRRLAFLTLGYRAKHRAWEGLILARSLALLIVTVVVSGARSASTMNMQLLITCLIFLGGLLLLARPFAPLCSPLRPLAWATANAWRRSHTSR